MELTESCDDLLRDIREKRALAPPAMALSDSRFDETHECFESSSNQQREIRRWLAEFLTNEFANSDVLRILSVGSGSGILDIPLVQTISSSFSRLLYRGLEPSPVACARFRQGLDALGLSNTEYQIHETTMEDFSHRPRVQQDPLDCIHAVHCLYYFDDPGRELDALRQLLSADGKLIVVQAPKAELNQLAECFWGEQYAKQIWFSQELQNYLESRDYEYEVQRIEAKVDVTACFEPGNEVGGKKLDFILQTPSDTLNADMRHLILQYLRRISTLVDSRYFAPHPADVFCIARD